MRRYLLLLSLSLFCLLAQGRPHPKLLTGQANIYVMTIAPGSELYSTFGHSAIWVSDPTQRFNEVYNYGVFDFQTVSPVQFYTNFTMGKMLYRLDTETWSYFQRVYHHFKRSYTAQRLNLDSAQIQQVYQFLEQNYLPENRNYWYDFLWDNCATRIRDLFEDQFPGQITWADPHVPQEETYRDLLHQYLVNSQWEQFGIDLALGSVIDTPSTPWTQTFLPDYLALALAKAEITDAAGTRPLVEPSNLMYKGEDANPSEPAWTAPLSILGALAFIVLGITLINWRKPIKRFWPDRTLFFVAGLAGTILLFLWLGTEHTSTRNNFNVLWLLPSMLVGAWFIRPKVHRWVVIHQLVLALLALSVLVGWAWWPQAFNPGFIPLIAILLIRSARLVFYWRQSPPLAQNPD